MLDASAGCRRQTRIMPYLPYGTHIRQKNKNADLNTLELNEEQIRLGNIQTDTVKERALSDKVTLTGTLNFNQQDIVSVSSRVMGRIERLYYKTLEIMLSKGHRWQRSQ